MSKIIYTKEQAETLIAFRPNVQPLLDGQSCHINTRSMQFKQIEQIYFDAFKTKFRSDCSPCAHDALRSLYNTLDQQPKEEVKPKRTRKTKG